MLPRIIPGSDGFENVERVKSGPFRGYQRIPCVAIETGCNGKANAFYTGKDEVIIALVKTDLGNWYWFRKPKGECWSFIAELDDPKRTSYLYWLKNAQCKYRPEVQ